MTASVFTGSISPFGPLPPEQPWPEPPRPEGWQLLLLEKTEAGEEVVRAELAAAGLRVVLRRATSRAALLQALAEQEPDLLLADFHGEDGFTALEALPLVRERRPRLPFLLFTDPLPEATAVECMKAGAWDCLSKEHARRLPNALLTALARQRAFLEKAAAEHALRESETRFRLAAQLASDLMYEWTLADGRVAWSGSLDQQLGPGSARRAASRRDWEAMIHPEDREFVGARIAERLSSGRRYDLHYRIVREDGAELHWHDRGALVLDAGGKPQRWIGVVTNTTQEVLAKLQLSEERNLLRTLIDTLPDFVFFLDTRHRYILNNRAHLRLLGARSQEETLGCTPEQFFLPEVAERELADNRAIFETGERVLNKEETWVDRADRRVTVLLTKAPLRNAHDEIVGLVGIGRDVTDHHQLSEQLRQSQKMEAVGRLAGGVAHDFNNILTAILGYSEIMLDTIPEGDPLAEDALAIKTAAERAASLTHQLLAFGRRQALVPKLLDVNRIVCDMQKLLARLIGEDIQFVCEPAPQPALVKADPGQMEQVIVNLAVHARDFMPRGGTLTLRVSRLRVPASGPAEAELKPGSYVQLQLSDTGEGMPPEHCERVFEPFFTTKQFGREGSGLGLATVYGIVKQSGGHIVCQSALGQGTQFTLAFPEATELPSPVRPGLTATLPGGKETLLVAEDEEAVREMLVRVLRGLGYQVIEAPNGRAAQEAVLADPSRRIDLLLTDVVMPQMGGHELARWLATVHPQAKVLMTSGHIEDAVLRMDMARGEWSFLQKPYTPSSIAHRVREVLSGEGAGETANA